MCLFVCKISKKLGRDFDDIFQEMLKSSEKIDYMILIVIKIQDLGVF